MKLDLKINDKVIGQLTCTEEDHDCVVSQFGLMRVTAYEHIADDDGNLKYVTPEGAVVLETEGNEPLMNHVPQFEEDGVTHKEERTLTLQKWVDDMANGLLRDLEPKEALIEGQRLLDNKIKNCKLRMK